MSRRGLLAFVASATLLWAFAAPPAQAAAEADLQPTAISHGDAVVGTEVRFDSGIRNMGGSGTGVFNVKWLVDGAEVGAYGSHGGVPAGVTVLDGNSQFAWTFNGAGAHTVTFTVDVDNHVVESNESSNSGSVSFLKERGASRVSAIRLGASSRPGRRAEVGVGVKARA